METMDRKAQAKHLEERNRSLHIELAKLRAKAHERQSRSKSRDLAREIEGLCDEIQETPFDTGREHAEVRASHQNFAHISGSISQLKSALGQKKQELAEMKLVKKEISERELAESRDSLELECYRFRKLCSGLMHKYSSKDEADGVTADDHHKYCYCNMVLNEYESLFLELRQSVKKSFQGLAKREVPAADQAAKRAQKEKNQKLDAQVLELDEENRLLDQRIEELKSQRLMRQQYDKNSLEVIRRERESLALESAELDRKTKDWEKLKHANVSFQSTKLAELKARLEEKTKEFERTLKLKSSSKFEDEEVEILKPHQLSLQSAQEEKIEVNRPVKHAQVEMPAKAINRRLRLKRIRIEDALEALFWVSPDDSSVRAGEISIFHLENNLRREPFWLQKKEQRLVARYLVEDNYADHIQFSQQNTQLKIIVATIFKTMVGPYELPELQRVREHFASIEKFLKKCRNTLLQVFTNKERKEVITSALFEEKLERMPHAMMVDLSQECKDIFVLHAVERSANPEDIELDKIFAFFTPDRFDSLYPPGFDTYNSTKSTPMYMRSVSRTKTTGKALHPFKSASGARTPLQSSRDNSEPGSRDDATKQPQERPSKDKQLDVLSEDLSQAGEEREEAAERDMPVPQLSINTVDTFNNPLTQEIIYKLEQVKVAKEVTVALEKIVFEGIFADHSPEAPDRQATKGPLQLIGALGEPGEAPDSLQGEQHSAGPRSFPLDLSKIAAQAPAKPVHDAFDPDQHIPEDPNDELDSLDDPQFLQTQTPVLPADQGGAIERPTAVPEDSASPDGYSAPTQQDTEHDEARLGEA